MKSTMTLAVLAFLAVTLTPMISLAIPVAPKSRDIKLATQQMIEKQSITDPIAAGTANVLSAFAGNTSGAAVTRTTFVAQPDVPRNLVITPGGSTADVAACDVVVNGTDFYDAALSETFSFLANASSATTGAKAFKTVTSVVFPALCEDSPYVASWSVGFGEKLGLKRCLDKAGHVLFSTIDGAKEATAATIAVSASAISGNTADFNGTMDGSADFELFFIQNFACFP